MTTPDDPYSVLTAYQRPAAIMAAGKRGVFAALKDGPIPASVVADKTGSSLPGTRALLRALAANGFIDRTDSEPAAYALNAFSEPFVRTGPRGLQRILHKEALFYQLWSDLDKVVENSEALLPHFRKRISDSPQLVRTFLFALNDIAETAADGVFGALEDAMGEHILDLGCGAGGYSLAMVRRFPQSRITAVDLPEVAALAAEYFQAEGQAESVELVAGDFLAGEDLLTGRTFDTVFLSHVLHDYPAEELASVVREAGRHLSPGGCLAILDVFEDTEEAYPVESLFGLMMMLENEGGRTHPRETIEQAVLAAGLEITRSEKLYFGSVLTARRSS